LRSHEHTKHLQAFRWFLHVPLMKYVHLRWELIYQFGLIKVFWLKEPSRYKIWILRWCFTVENSTYKHPYLLFHKTKSWHQSLTWIAIGRPPVPIGNTNRDKSGAPLAATSSYVDENPLVSTPKFNQD
jgi:hypothetical protein